MKNQLSLSENYDTIAVFDFDHTLTDRHTFWRFLVFLVGPIKFFFVAISLIPTVYRFYSKKINMMEAREVMIRRCMTKVPYEEYIVKGKKFAVNSLNEWIKPEAEKKLRWHQEQGHYCILISNSADCYLTPWSKHAGFDSVSGSRFEAVDDRLTGQLIGEHCQGPEKVVRLKQLVGDPSRYKIYAYGDSVGDKELLDISDFPFYRKFN